ncbi:hypothetical protein FOVG_13491 [Fusarium oxysporum f. sp. pisi HDV247]|uniref:Uncharacterized protein n=1 Tax=Fusarium oxysporum f. sp. pisi HDV247 TaxID=1080344 RepID=W9P621_FUSOX|nr:hypothetical protein FOVG_13491 [Fusarium oxysporum f. sp. pisi HDV247]
MRSGLIWGCTALVEDVRDSGLETRPRQNCNLTPNESLYEPPTLLSRILSPSSQEWKFRDTQEPCPRQWAAKSSLSSRAISTGSPLSHPMSKPSRTRWLTPTKMHV